MSNDSLMGIPVVARGEAFIRQVVEVRGDRARCRRYPPNEDDVHWFALDDLKCEDGRPARLVF